MSGAIIYCRVSTKEQTENLSLPTQLKACRDYCQREGLEVIQVFMEEGESAKSPDRPQLKRLLEYCRKNKHCVRCVVVYSLTRFSREAMHHHVIRGFLRGVGVTLRSATEPIDDSPAGKFIEGILASAAQFDNDVKAERTRAGMRAALELGRWTFQAPLGYLSGTKHGPSLVPDPERAELVLRGFTDYARGLLSQREILRRLTTLGLRTRGGRDLSAQTFEKMLKNPIYTGAVVVPSWGISCPGDFDALIPKKLFDCVQARLAGKGTVLTPHERSHPDFPLRRFARCAECGLPLTGSWSRGRSGRYAYYSCRKNHVRVAKLDLERAFLDLLERLQPDPGYMKLFNAVVRDAWRTRQLESRATRATLEKRVQVLRERQDHLDETFIFQKKIDQSSYERQRDKLREERALAEMELHDATLEELDVEGILVFAEHVLTNASGLWSEASLDQKQRLQQVFFPEGLEFDGERFGTAATCLAFKLLQPSEDSESRMASPAGFEPASPA